MVFRLRGMFTLMTKVTELTGYFRIQRKLTDWKKAGGNT